MRRGSQTLPFEIEVPVHPGSAEAGKEKKAAKDAAKAEADGEGADGKKVKKKKRGGGVVIKPIPADSPSDAP
jgi:hypothetical protein